MLEINLQLSREEAADSVVGLTLALTEVKDKSVREALKKVRLQIIKQS